MKQNRAVRALPGVLLAILLLGVCAVVYAATAADGTAYTVTFDAADGTFRFSDNVRVNRVDGAFYPDLFRIEAAMPGDRYEWSIRVRVKNAEGATVKLYVTAGDYNADYARLLDAGTPNSPTLTATFDSARRRTVIPTGLLTRLLGERFTDTASRVASFEQHVGVDSYGVYLGAYYGALSEKQIALAFSMPADAGNEFADLDAWVHWVFTAEVIPDDDVPPTAPGAGNRPYRVREITDLLERGQRVNIGGFPILPDMLGTPWAFETDDHFAYIIGVPGREVRPAGLITRGEVVTILFRCLREELRDYWWCTSNAFTDVPGNLWCNNAISTMARAGVILGHPDGTFSPNDPITRAEFCAMIGRYFSLLRTDAADFPDIRGHWAEELIRSVSARGIVVGYEDGTFRPDNSVLRAEAVTIMNRVLNRAPAPGCLLPEMLEWPDNMDTTAWYYLDMQEATNSHDCVRSDGHEVWTRWSPPPDWKRLETLWADRNTNSSVRIHKSTETGGGT